MYTAWLTGIFTMCSPLDLFRQQVNPHGMVCTVYKYMWSPRAQTGCWHLKKQPLDYWAAASDCTLLLHWSRDIKWFAAAGGAHQNQCLCTPSAKRGCAQLTICAPDVMQNLAIGVCLWRCKSSEISSGSWSTASSSLRLSPLQPFPDAPQYGNRLGHAGRHL